jgi:hypothetical protein
MTFMIISILFLFLAGLVALNFAMKSAATGYEDEYGFHSGNEPQNAMDYAVLMHAEIVQQVVGDPKPSLRARRIIRRARQHSISQEAIGHESAVPFTH